MGTRELLANADFRRLWMAQLVSFFGDSLTTMGLLFLVQRTYGDAGSVAGILIANTLPFLLVGLVAGVWVDRWNRKVVMVWTDLVRAGLVLLVPVIGADHLWLLYALIFVHASVGTFFAPARMALFPRVVPPEGLAQANGLGESTRPIAMVAGTATAGLLVGLFDGFAAVFFIDALTFVASAMLVLRVATSGAPDNEPTAGGARAVLGELLAGFAAIRSSRLLVGIVLGGAVAMFGLGAVNAVMVPFVVGELGLAETWFGVIEAAQTIGMVAAGMSVGWLAGRFGLPRMVIGGIGATGVLVASLSLVDGLAGMAVVLFAMGLTLAPLMAAVSTLLQTETPPEKLGRVASSLNAVVTGASVGSMAIAASLAAVIGIRGVFLAAGALAIVAALMTAVLFAGAPVAEPEAAEVP